MSKSETRFSGQREAGTIKVVRFAGDETLKSFLLQRHDMTLKRLWLLDVINRFLCILCVVFTVVLPTELWMRMVFFFLTIIITLFWRAEKTSLLSESEALEEEIAKRTSEEWEDLFIKVKYQSRQKSTRSYVLLRVEPEIWPFISGLWWLTMYLVRNLPQG